MPRSSNSLTPALLRFRDRVIDEGARTFQAELRDASGPVYGWTVACSTWEKACAVCARHFAEGIGLPGCDWYAVEFALVPAEYGEGAVCVRARRFA